MKYFTTQLFIDLQSSNSAKADRAEDDFEQALVRYRKRLDRIRHELPRAIRHLALELQLHDAEVLSLARENGQFLVVLRLPGGAARTVILTYTLTGEPKIDDSALPTRYSSISACWLYDEVDISKAKKDFRHRILLSNGWEVQLPFRDVKIFEADGILPSPKILETEAVAHGV
jgi:hypothetical protein